MPLPTSTDWEYFHPDESSNTIHGMERMLEDGSAIDVIAYGSYEAPGEFSWMIRIWDDEQGYSVRASYDDDCYYRDIEEAYDALCEVLEDEYPYLVERDEIVHDPRGAKSRFFAKLAAIGLAAALAIPTLTGCAGGMAWAAFQYDAPLESNTGSITYSQIIQDSVFYEGYEGCVSIMESGDNPEIDGAGRGWYDGDFVFEDLDINMLNYAVYDNPLYSMYKTGADNGISLTLNETTGDIRIRSNATEQGDDFDMMYAQVDAEARKIADIAYRESDGSTAEYVRSVLQQVSDSVEYTNDTSSAHCNDIYGALINGSSRCLGYSAAVKYILDLQGIPNFIATGHTSDRHAWNMVEIDGHWLVVDATASATMTSDEGASCLEECMSPWVYCLRDMNEINRDLKYPYMPEAETAALMNLHS